MERNKIFGPGQIIQFFVGTHLSAVFLPLVGVICRPVEAALASGQQSWQNLEFAFMIHFCQNEV